MSDLPIDPLFDPGLQSLPSDSRKGLSGTVEWVGGWKTLPVCPSCRRPFLEGLLPRTHCIECKPSSSNLSMK